MTASDLAEWTAWYVLEAADADPEVTEWDDDESIQRKLARKADR